MSARDLVLGIETIGFFQNGPNPLTCDYKMGTDDRGSKQTCSEANKGKNFSPYLSYMRPLITSRTAVELFYRVELSLLEDPIPDRIICDCELTYIRPLAYSAFAVMRLVV